MRLKEIEFKDGCSAYCPGIGGSRARVITADFADMTFDPQSQTVRVQLRKEAKRYLVPTSALMTLTPADEPQQGKPK